MWDWTPDHGATPPPGSSIPILVTSEVEGSTTPAAHPQPIIIPQAQELRRQFQQQQAFLAQIKETILENDADRTNKERQLEMYTQKLHQIKNRSRNRSEKKEDSSSSMSTPDPKPTEPPQVVTTPVESKMTELKRRLEENKIKFEERAEKGLADTKKIESMVEHLRTQVQERDITIHEIQKTMATPPARPRPKVQSLPKRYKDRPVILSKWTQTQNTENESHKKQIEKLQATIVDHEDTIKQQASVIEARTQAITLLSGDLSKKGKTTLDDLEDTRVEMREMQSNFVVVENQMKNQLMEKDKRLAFLEESLKTLENSNRSVLESHANLEKQLADSLAENDSLRSQAVNDAIVGELEKKVASLEKELDESNKLMIRIKLDQKQKLKADKRKQVSGGNPESVELASKVEQLEKYNSDLQNKIIELEDEKASNYSRITELKKTLEEKEAKVNLLVETTEIQAKEKGNLLLTIEDQNILVDNLNARIEALTSGDAFTFNIPGDQAAQMFSDSNDALQTKISDILSEKQELLGKLKSSLHGAQPAMSNEPDKLLKLEAELSTERTKVAECETKINNLESQISILEASTHSQPGANTLKNKLKKVIAELKKEKARIEQLTKELATKEQVIADLNLKMSNFERTRQDSVSSLGEPDIPQIQQKYLSMEEELLQLAEKYEHLRKENIELTGEKVRRLQTEEEMAEMWIMAKVLENTAQLLTARVATLESMSSNPDLQYANIVIASNDTEIFNLQSSLANKTQEFDLLNEKINSISGMCSDLQLELERRNDQLKSQMSEKQEALQTIDNYQLHISGLMSTISDKTLECEELGKQLATINDVDVGLRQQLDSCSEMIDTLKTSLQAKTEEVARLQSSSANFDRLADDVRALNNKNSRMKEEMHRLQVSLESVMMECTQERNKAEERLLKLQEMSKQYDETRNALDATWAERNDAIHSRDGLLQNLRHVEGEYNKLIHERDEARAQYQQLASAASLHQVQDLQNELQKRTQEVTSKNAELEVMTTKAKKLVANLKKKSQIESELSAQVQSLKDLNEQLIKQVNEQNTVQNAGASIENERLLQKLEHAENEKLELNEQLEGLLAEMQSLLQQLNAISTEKQTVEQKLTEIVAEVDRLRNELNTLNVEKLEHHAKLEKLEETSLQYTTQINALVTENSSLQQQLSNLQQTICLEKTAKDTLQSQHDNLCQRLSGLEQAFEMEQQENEMLTSQRSTSLQEIETLKEKCNQATAALKIAETEKSELDAKVRQLESLASEESFNARKLFEARSEFESVLQTRNAALDEANLMISQLQTSLFSLQSEKEALEEKLITLQGIVDDQSRLGDIVQERNNALSEASTRIAALEAQILSLNAERTNLSEALTRIEEETNTEINDYDIQVANLQKQVNNFNVAFDAEVQKNASLKSDVESLNVYIQRLEDNIKSFGKDDRQEKKRKSVTFTDEADYIKELRGEVTRLQKALVESDTNVGELKAALVESSEKHVEPATKAFRVDLFDKPPAGDFLTESADPADPFAPDSLQWDDSWGAEGQLEADHMFQKASQESPEKVQKLEHELKAVYSEKESVQEELRVLQVKYSKIVKKLKEQKLSIDQLQNEIKSSKLVGSGFDLNDTLVEELRAEVQKAEGRALEARKELENTQKEKESLLKRIDMLNAGNEKFLEMKERQDTEASIWQARNSELRSQIAQLETQLLTPADDNQLALENRDLKNLIEGLEWKVSELTEMIEENDEKWSNLESQKPAEKLNAELSKQLEDSESQMTMLVAENEALQSILNDQKVNAQQSAESAPKTSLSQWFSSDPHTNDPFNSPEMSVVWETVDEIKQLKDDLNIKNQQIEKITLKLAEAVNEKAEVANLLCTREEEVRQLQEKLQKISKDYEESRLEIERLLEEDRSKYIPAEELQSREQEIMNLQRNVNELQLAYEQSKLEVERMLQGDGMASGNDDLSQQFESERSKYENIIMTKNMEIQKLRQEIESFEKEYDEAQGKNDGAVQELKSQLRELESSCAHAAEARELEMRETQAECCELRELLTSRQLEIQKLHTDLNAVEFAVIQNNEWREASMNDKASGKRYEQLREEYNKALEYLGEKTQQLSQVQPLIDQKEMEVLTLKQELRAAQHKFTSRESEFGQQQALLEADFLARDAEVRELRAERLELESEIRELRSSIQQLQDLNITKPTEISDRKREGNELSTLLQSDLDTALYRLHQRDVRCEELTYELTQLLEERDELQLRLSTAIRQNEEMRQLSVSLNSSDLSQGQLDNKISELHKIGYNRDKNIQDESQQRHREQMALVTRQSTANVMDI